MITLYRFGPQWGFGCVSQFVLKMDTYLRMAELPFQTTSLQLKFGELAPKGKLPYIEHDGVKLADSGFIIDYLKSKLGDKHDAGLSATERATAHCIRRVCEENLVWVMAYERWSSPQEPYFHTPGLFFELGHDTYVSIRDSFLKRIKEHGMGSHTAAEVAQIGKEDLDALDVMLGKQKFFAGDKPTSIDATAYAFLAHASRPAYESRLKETFDSKQNLVDYTNRMTERFFRDDPTSTAREVPLS